MNPQHPQPVATLRDQLAMQALAGLMANSTRSEPGEPGLPFSLWRWVGAKPWFDADDAAQYDPANWAVREGVGRLAYAAADALLAARDGRPR